MDDVAVHAVVHVSGKKWERVGVHAEWFSVLWCTVQIDGMGNGCTLKWWWSHHPGCDNEFLRSA